ncbi:hypothetical protein Lal_00021086 [Lupinus albus]|nr:hypothetical protein Lal_00021086 [Lupinus albus]
MSSQNEVNEEGTMINTQTPITQTPEPQTPQTQTQKRKPRGITAMKSVVRSRNNNNKLTVEWNAKGQPLNNKGGNKSVSYIGVVVRQNISIKLKHWSDDRLNATKDIIWKNIIATFDVGEEHKDYIMKSVGKALREFRTNCGKCLRDAEGNVNFIRYLYDNFVPKCKKKVMFISPQANILGAGMVPNDTWKKQQSQEVAKILDENKEIANLFFAPPNTGALNTYRALNPKRQKPAKWIHVKTPHQNNNTDCGFYVINFMMEVIKQGKTEVNVVIYFHCGMDNYHSEVIYFRCGRREDPINNKSTTPDIFNTVVF